MSSIGMIVILSVHDELYTSAGFRTRHERDQTLRETQSVLRFVGAEIEDTHFPYDIDYVTRPIIVRVRHE